MFIPITLKELSMNILKDYSLEVLQSKVPVVLFFSADWCRACASIKPFVEREALLHICETETYYVDVEDHADLAQSLRLKSLPSFYLFVDGRLENMSVGAVKDGIKSLYSRD